MTNSNNGNDREISHRSQRSTQAAREANERGLALVDENKVDQAEEAFRLAIQHDERFAPAHNNLGLVLLTQGELYEAAVEFRAASDLDSSAPEPVFNLARLYERIGWERGAALHLEQASDLEQPKSRNEYRLTGHSRRMR